MSEHRAAPSRVVTAARLAAAPAEVFDRLLFFEEIRRRPPLLLGLLLPRPLCTDGPRTRAGDETSCLYQGGRLVKRTTRMVRPSTLEFEIVLQELPIRSGIRLVGGRYALAATSDGSTDIEIETRYEGGARPRRLWRRIEAAVAHAFHRHLIGAIEDELKIQRFGPRARSTSGPSPVPALPHHPPA